MLLELQNHTLYNALRKVSLEGQSASFIQRMEIYQLKLAKYYQNIIQKKRIAQKGVILFILSCCLCFIFVIWSGIAFA
uniref:Uncharacterized protein n=1 Tax=Virgibacillus oceani TaxID=1479511 RepID=A0A917HNJ8_9BACI|nr:hypothetical protein GCM10011398_33880 [Virgibacillus oceani]